MAWKFRCAECGKQSLQKRDIYSIQQGRVVKKTPIKHTTTGRDVLLRARNAHGDIDIGQIKALSSVSQSYHERKGTGPLSQRPNLHLERARVRGDQCRSSALMTGMASLISDPTP